MLITMHRHSIAHLLPFLIADLPDALLHEVLRLDVALDGQEVEEVVLGTDVGMLRQSTFCYHIALTEFLLAHGDAHVLVALPQHLAPMHGVRVDGAAVVEDDGRNRPSPPFGHLPRNGEAIRIVTQ